jgi:hypothetical protein
LESWKIVKDRTRCTKPGCPLAASLDYIAVLELPSCLRRDVCEGCFRELEAAAGKPLLFWRGRRRGPGKTGPAIDLPSLRELFDRLGQEQQPDQMQQASGLRYLIALLLLRKRWFKMVDPSNEQQEAADLLVVDPKIENMEPVALFAPELGDAALDALKGELLAALGEEAKTGQGNGH